MFKYFAFNRAARLTVKTRGAGKGILIVSKMPEQSLAELPIETASSWSESSVIIDWNGSEALYFTFMGRRSIECQSFTFQNVQ